MFSANLQKKSKIAAYHLYKISFSSVKTGEFPDGTRKICVPSVNISEFPDKTMKNSISSGNTGEIPDEARRIMKKAARKDSLVFYTADRLLHTLTV